MVVFSHTNIWDIKMRKSKLGVALILAAGCFVYSAFDANGGLISTAAAEEPTAGIPANEQAFIAIVNAAIESSNSAKNDMQRGGIKAKRDDSICAKLKSRKVKDWVGKVSKIDSNGDGKGVLAIELADKVEVKTWNNALSDISDKTLIEPRSALFQTASQLAEGDTVVFSGLFFKGGESCIEESSMSLRGGLEEPEFIFRFTDI